MCFSKEKTTNQQAKKTNIQKNQTNTWKKQQETENHFEIIKMSLSTSLT
jgi:uncharacterized membrane-anchored protein YhcB (DUF1043 family)